MKLSARYFRLGDEERGKVETKSWTCRQKRNFYEDLIRDRREMRLFEMCCR